MNLRVHKIAVCSQTTNSCDPQVGYRWIARTSLAMTEKRDRGFVNEAFETLYTKTVFLTKRSLAQYLTLGEFRKLEFS